MQAFRALPAAGWGPSIRDDGNRRQPGRTLLSAAFEIVGARVGRTLLSVGFDVDFRLDS